MLGLQRFFSEGREEMRSEAAKGRGGTLASELSPRLGLNASSMRTVGKQNSHLAGVGDREF